MKRVNKDQYYHNARMTDSMKIPIFSNLAQVGDEPGMEGNIIFNRDGAGSFCYHNGTTWVCLPDNSGGAVTSVDGANVGVGTGELFSNTAIVGTDYTLNFRRLTSNNGAGEGSGGITITTDIISPNTVNLVIDPVTAINVGNGQDIYNDSPPSNPLEFRRLEGAANFGTPSAIEAEDVVINDIELIRQGLNPVVDGNKVGVPVLQNLNIFVDPTGNDDFDGLTVGTAVFSVARAFEILRFRGYSESAQINLAAGDYSLTNGTPSSTANFKCGNRGQEKGPVILRGALSSIKSGTISDVISDSTNDVDGLLLIEAAANAFTAEDEGRVIVITNGPQSARYIMGNRPSGTNNRINLCTIDTTFAVIGATYEIFDRETHLTIDNELEIVGDNSLLYFVDLDFRVADITPTPGLNTTAIAFTNLSAKYLNVSFTEDGIQPISPPSIGLILYSLSNSRFETFASNNLIPLPPALATDGPAGVAILVPFELSPPPQPPFVTDRSLFILSDSNMSFQSSYTLGFDNAQSTVQINCSASMTISESIFSINANTCINSSKRAIVRNVRGNSVQTLITGVNSEVDIADCSVQCNGIGSTIFELTKCNLFVRDFLADGNDNSIELLFNLIETHATINDVTARNLNNGPSGSRFIEVNGGTVQLFSPNIDGIFGNVMTFKNCYVDLFFSNLINNPVQNWGSNNNNFVTGIICDWCQINLQNSTGGSTFQTVAGTNVANILAIKYSNGTVSGLQLGNTFLANLATNGISITQSTIELQSIGLEAGEENFTNLIVANTSDLTFTGSTIADIGVIQNLLFCQSVNLVMDGVNLSNSLNSVMILQSCIFNISSLTISKDFSPPIGPGSGIEIHGSKGTFFQPQISNVTSTNAGDGIFMVNSDVGILSNNATTFVTNCDRNGIQAVDKSNLYIQAGGARSTISNNGEHGILLIGSDAMLTNLAIDNNGQGSPPQWDGIHAIGSTMRCINIINNGGSLNNNFGIFLTGNSHASGLGVGPATTVSGTAGQMQVGSLGPLNYIGGLNAFDYPAGPGSGVGNEGCSAIGE